MPTLLHRFGRFAVVGATRDRDARGGVRRGDRGGARGAGACHGAGLRHRDADGFRAEPPMDLRRARCAGAAALALRLRRARGSRAQRRDHVLRRAPAARLAVSRPRGGDRHRSAGELHAQPFLGLSSSRRREDRRRNDELLDRHAGTALCHGSTPERMAGHAAVVAAFMAIYIASSYFGAAGPDTTRDVAAALAIHDLGALPLHGPLLAGTSHLGPSVVLSIVAADDAGPLVGRRRSFRFHHRQPAVSARLCGRTRG